MRFLILVLLIVIGVFSPFQILVTTAAENTTITKNIQSLLAKNGYSPGAIDGLCGPGTRKKLREFLFKELKIKGDNEKCTKSAYLKIKKITDEKIKTVPKKTKKTGDNWLSTLFNKLFRVLAFVIISIVLYALFQALAKLAIKNKEPVFAFGLFGLVLLITSFSPVSSNVAVILIVTSGFLSFGILFIRIYINDTKLWRKANDTGLYQEYIRYLNGPGIKLRRKLALNGSRRAVHEYMHLLTLMQYGEENKGNKILLNLLWDLAHQKGISKINVGVSFKRIVGDFDETYKKYILNKEKLSVSNEQKKAYLRKIEEGVDGSSEKRKLEIDRIKNEIKNVDNYISRKLLDPKDYFTKSNIDLVSGKLMNVFSEVMKELLPEQLINLEERSDTVSGNEAETSPSSFFEIKYTIVPEGIFSAYKTDSKGKKDSVDMLGFRLDWSVHFLRENENKAIKLSTTSTEKLSVSKGGYPALYQKMMLSAYGNFGKALWHQLGIYRYPEKRESINSSEPSKGTYKEKTQQLRKAFSQEFENISTTEFVGLLAVSGTLDNLYNKNKGLIESTISLKSLEFDEKILEMVEDSMSSIFDHIVIPDIEIE